MVDFTQGSIIANQSGIDIVAQDPGDIVAIFMPSTGESVTSPAQIGVIKIPLKAFTSDKTVDVTPIYGTGSHQAYQKTYGKVGYKGSFTINTWIDQSEKMKLEKLIFSQDEFEGTPLEFDIIITDRMGNSSGSGSSSNIARKIVTCKYCTASSAGIDIGEPGNPIATKYEFIALRREPL